MRREFTADEALAIAAARFVAAQRMPYLSAALFAMLPIAAPGLGTFAVDRAWRLYVDPQVLATWAVDQTAGVMLHEVQHLVREHSERARAVGATAGSHQLWNIAADAAINDDLLAGRIELPATPVTPETISAPQGLTEERYYAHLLRRRAELCETASCGSGAGATPLAHELGDEPKAHGSTTAINATEAALIRRQVARAISAAPGGAPAGLARWAADYDRSSDVNWGHELSAVVGALSARRGGPMPTWSRPPRRPHPDLRVLAPGRRSTHVELCVIIDTSASMSEDHLGLVVSEIGTIQRQLGAPRLWALIADHADVSVHRVPSIDRVELVGGGGTDLRSAIAATADLRPRPDICVVLTDGYTPWPDEPLPGTVLVVASTTDEVCPIPGVRTVHLT